MYNKNIKSVTWHKRITIQRCENANYGMKKLHVLSPHQLFTTTVPIKGSINNMSSSRRWIYEYQCSSLDCYKSHKKQNSSYDPNYGNMSIYRVCIYICLHAHICGLSIWTRFTNRLKPTKTNTIINFVIDPRS